MEINEYVRTKYGITQYKEYETSEGKLLCMPLINGLFANIEDIIKHSKDIIDIIEVGDYVNGYRVCEIFNHGFKNDKVIIEIPFNLRIDSDDYIKTFIHIKDIKSILTKEQFEANAYTIEKER